MPKLDGTQIADRLAQRLAELREGKAVARRKLCALLSQQQIDAMDAAWAEQQMLRAVEPAPRTSAQRTALGWKTKRQLHIDAYEQALAAANDGMLDTLAALQRQAQVRQAHIYTQSYTSAREHGKTQTVARNLANNDLTRSKLARVDSGATHFRNRRDREVWEMEQELRARAVSQMTQEQREQMQLVEEHERTLNVSNKKRRG